MNNMFGNGANNPQGLVNQTHKENREREERKIELLESINEKLDYIIDNQIEKK